MNFNATPLSGLSVIELEPRADERGFFARAFCAREFEQQALATHFVQANLAFNHRRGTLRGLHYLAAPAREPKFIRCIRGAVWDVVVDLRPDSPTYLQHFGVELSADNRRAIYVPEMFAHGYQTLTDDTELLYMVGEYYVPGYERGLRYDDPALNLKWPEPVTAISPKDCAWPLLSQPAPAGAGSAP